MDSTTGEQKQAFLLDVVNGRDRWSDYDRADFKKLYQHWFPAYDSSQLAKHKEHYKKVRAAWSTSLRKFPVEEPDEEFGLKIVLLRHQLRVLWIVQSCERKHIQDMMVSQIAVAIYGMERPKPERWRSLQICALRWLTTRLDRLIVCGNPECSTKHTYFFRESPNAQYCCNPCVAEAKQLRADLQRKSRVSSGAITGASVEARINMSKSAIKRWAERKRKREEELQLGLFIEAE